MAPGVALGADIAGPRRPPASAAGSSSVAVPAGAAASPAPLPCAAAPACAASASPPSASAGASPAPRSARPFRQCCTGIVRAISDAGGSKTRVGSRPPPPAVLALVSTALAMKPRASPVFLLDALVPGEEAPPSGRARVAVADRPRLPGVSPASHDAGLEVAGEKAGVAVADRPVSQAYHRHEPAVVLAKTSSAERSSPGSTLRHEKGMPSSRQISATARRVMPSSTLASGVATAPSFTTKTL